MAAALALSLLALAGSPLAAPGAEPALPDLAVRLAAMTAVTGYEQRLVDSLLALLPGAARDRAGNAVVVLGAGARRRLVACPVERARIRRRRRARRRLADAAAGAGAGLAAGRAADRGPAGHAVRPPRAPCRASSPCARSTSRGAAAAAGEERSRSTAPTWTSARASRAEVATAGVGVLRPVALAKRPQRYGSDLLAAPVAARRTACAALVLAARRAVAEQGMVPRGESVVVAFVVEQDLDGRGLGTIANTRGPFAETVIVDGGAGSTPGPSRERRTRRDPLARARRGDALVAGRALPGDGGGDDLARRCRYPRHRAGALDRRRAMRRRAGWGSPSRSSRRPVLVRPGGGAARARWIRCLGRWSRATGFRVWKRRSARRCSDCFPAGREPRPIRPATCGSRWGRASRPWSSSRTWTRSGSR